MRREHGTASRVSAIVMARVLDPPVPVAAALERILSATEPSRLVAPAVRRT